VGAVNIVWVFLLWISPAWGVGCLAGLTKEVLTNVGTEGARLKSEPLSVPTQEDPKRVLIEVIHQTGLNPVSPDFRRLRDGSKIFLAVPATLDQETGFLHLSYDVYRFENLDRAPLAVVSLANFISQSGVKTSVRIAKDVEGTEFSVSIGNLSVDPGTRLYASLGPEVVKPYLEFLRPFASSRMSDGSMVPAHRLSQLTHVKSLGDAQKLRRWARMVNMKNFLIEACKRYGLYTVLGLTGVRQLVLSLQDEEVPSEIEEERIDELEEKLEDLKKLIEAQGFRLIEDEEGSFLLKPALEASQG
jgi:hypothetical protein